MQLHKSKLLSRFKNITHTFTTNSGGTSKAPYDSLNLAFHVDDNTDDVIINHAIIAKELNYKNSSLVHMKQIHSDIVHIVAENDNFDNPPTCDALITDKKNTPLMVMVADCSPILFYDKEKEIIAVAHAGRAGTFKNIVKNVLDTYADEFKSEIKNIYVTIGASIGVCCYEVGSEIATQAKELDLEYGIEENNDRYYLDVNKILKEQLLSYGLKEENIEILNECTSCNKNYFSYRRDGLTGRFAGVIMLK